MTAVVVTTTTTTLYLTNLCYTLVRPDAALIFRETISIAKFDFTA